MNKTSTVRARLEPDLKDKAEKVFRKLGLTSTQAITLFYKQVEIRTGLPFDVVTPMKPHLELLTVQMPVRIWSFVTMLKICSGRGGIRSYP